jgi:methionyl-tRNA formyltransferase
MTQPRIAFFGTPRFAVSILKVLEERGILPDLIVAQPDRPKGRKLVVTPPDTKVWATERGISVYQPETLRNDEVVNWFINEGEWDLFIVAAYGLIIPQRILDIPRRGTLNVHPSLLPKLRGASPIQSSILSEDQTGVTIMEMDAEMDHGPIVSQKQVPIAHWPPCARDLEDVLAREGAHLLADAIPEWLDDTLPAIPQEHESATYCKKIIKEDALLDLSGDPEINLRKILAFHEWPKAYYFEELGGKALRVVVTDAHIAPDGSLHLDRVIPEGRKEMTYANLCDLLGRT